MCIIRGEFMALSRFSSIPGLQKVKTWGFRSMIGGDFMNSKESDSRT